MSSSAGVDGIGGGDFLNIPADEIMFLLASRLFVGRISKEMTNIS